VNTYFLPSTKDPLRCFSAVGMDGENVSNSPRPWDEGMIFMRMSSQATIQMALVGITLNRLREAVFRWSWDEKVVSNGWQGCCRS